MGFWKRKHVVEPTPDPPNTPERVHQWTDPPKEEYGREEFLDIVYEIFDVLGFEYLDSDINESVKQTNFEGFSLQLTGNTSSGKRRYILQARLIYDPNAEIFHTTEIMQSALGTSLIKFYENEYPRLKAEKEKAEECERAEAQKARDDKSAAQVGKLNELMSRKSIQ